MIIWKRLLRAVFRARSHVSFGGSCDLLYRTGSTSTGLLIGFGFGLSVFAGWRVPECGKFPLGFKLMFLDRVDYAHVYVLMSFGLSVGKFRYLFNLGTISARDLR